MRCPRIEFAREHTKIAQPMRKHFHMHRSDTCVGRFVDLNSRCAASASNTAFLTRSKLLVRARRFSIYIRVHACRDMQRNARQWREGTGTRVYSPAEEGPLYSFTWRQFAPQIVTLVPCLCGTRIHASLMRVRPALVFVNVSGVLPAFSAWQQPWPRLPL